MTKEERNALLYKPQNGLDRISAVEEAEMNDYCEQYKAFLDVSKTERECVVSAIRLAEAKGFKPYTPGMDIAPGDKLYYNNRGKAIMLMIIGQKPLSEGANIGAAHTDSPRLDLKPNPLYEDAELAYLKTHHYGGVRKYQWVTVPLELHGLVVRRDGSEVYVKIGDDPKDPQLVINDLLPHLGREQGKKPLNEAIPSETLNILVGSRPLRDDDGSDRVKVEVLRLLNEKYGITEEDFISAELCLVPAQNAVDVGLDRSVIGAYGHDDFVCAYPALTAMLESKGEHTVITVLADKEETGSDGNTGMQCRILVDLIDELASAFEANPNVVRANSMCISADVHSAFDSNYPDVFEKRNSAIMACGITMSKYTGSGGKYSTNDASAEYVGYIRSLFAKHGVLWQTAELGKVDAGGGGTVAKYISKENIDTVDLGVPVMCMHAPFELISKYDLYSAHLAYTAFVLG